MLHHQDEVIKILREFPMDQIEPKTFKTLIFIAYNTDPFTMKVWKTIDDLCRSVNVTRAIGTQILKELEEDGFIKCDGDTITFLDNEYIKIAKEQPRKE